MNVLAAIVAWLTALIPHIPAAATTTTRAPAAHVAAANEHALTAPAPTTTTVPATVPDVNGADNGVPIPAADLDMPELVMVPGTGCTWEGTSEAEAVGWLPC